MHRLESDTEEDCDFLIKRRATQEDTEQEEEAPFENVILSPEQRTQYLKGLYSQPQLCELALRKSMQPAATSVRGRRYVSEVERLLLKGGLKLRY